ASIERHHVTTSHETSPDGGDPTLNPGPKSRASPGIAQRSQILSRLAESALHAPALSPEEQSLTPRTGDRTAQSFFVIGECHREALPREAAREEPRSFTQHPSTARRPARLRRSAAANNKQQRTSHQP
ncbi:MAG: hypothetical protein M3463_15570, partial [Verrucomicrobiota bacterium]|nr:hypothetical protein [Verrucomicrobiota bacterium]